MATKKTYRVGIIGAGSIAQECHVPGYNKNKQSEVVAYVDPVKARRDEMAKLCPNATPYKHYKDMLANEKLDVVSVCTPNKYHAPATIAALEAGCHVLCEKPMAVSLKEADAMIETAKKKRKKLMIGFTHRFLAGPQRCKDLLDKKAIGKPFMIRARLAHSGPYPGWAKGDWFYKKSEAAGGALLDMGIHAIDLCHWLMGPITEVSAQVDTLVKKIEVDDNAVLMLKFKNGSMGYVESGWTSRPGFMGFEVYGTEGSIICNYVDKMIMVEGNTKGLQRSPQGVAVVEAQPATGGWENEIDGWIDVVSGKEKLVMTGAVGRHALDVALTAYKASKSGKRTKITG